MTPIKCPIKANYHLLLNWKLKTHVYEKNPQYILVWMTFCSDQMKSMWSCTWLLFCRVPIYKKTTIVLLWRGERYTTITNKNNSCLILNDANHSSDKFSILFFIKSSYLPKVFAIFTQFQNKRISNSLWSPRVVSPRSACLQSFCSFPQRSIRKSNPYKFCSLFLGPIVAFNI